MISKTLHFSLFLILALIAHVLSAEQEETEEPYGLDEDILYRSGEDLTPYMEKRCRLDVYYPLEKKGFATVVWFHGGGLEKGNRSVPEGLEQKGIAVVPVNYRLSPQVKSPAYVEDAAAAVAWTFANIERYGGSAEKIYVSGHSAGGYLTLMVGMDKRWLAAHDLDADTIAGLIPYSGQTFTHFTIRKERGLERQQIWADDMAPLHHVRDDAPPLLLITGDRDLELFGRYEENAVFWRMMQAVKHPSTELYELEGYTHAMAEPAHPLLMRFITNVETGKKK